MKHSQKLLVASAVLAGIAAIPLTAQNLPPNFGTPQGTNALAASAGFVDILGIKLGMPAEQALALLKSSYPASKITLQRTGDYEAAWHTVEQQNPRHQWVFQIDVVPTDVSGDTIAVALSLPPSKQVVTSVSRSIFFKEPVAVENIVAGLRKKYGKESYGVDYSMGGLIGIFDGSSKQFLWVYDLQGNQVKPDAVTARATNCLLSAFPRTEQQGLSASGIYETNNLKDHPCSLLVVLNATIQIEGSSQGIAGKAQGFSVTAVDWPLASSGANALYAFLDEGARDDAAKQAADAKKRGGDVKY